MRYLDKRLLVFLDLLLLATALLVHFSSAAVTVAKPPGGSPGARPLAHAEGPAVVGRAYKSDTSLPLRAMRPLPAPGGPPHDQPPPFLGAPGPRPRPPSGSVDPVVQRAFGPLLMPTPTQNFEGIANQWGVYPPDPNGAVGPSHYFQMLNVGFRIWDKSGNPLTPVINNNTIWTGLGGPCETSYGSDPIVLYDHLADRWLLSQLAWPTNGPFYECIAVSTGSDPTGTYYRYVYLTSQTLLNDYPKFSVWPDAYYMTDNEDRGVNLVGVGSYAFDRARMLSGDPNASYQYFHLPSPYFGFLPADVDGPTPPAGSPNYSVMITSYDYGWPADTLQLWQFHVDWSDPNNSTFAQTAALPTAPFHPIFAAISQPGTTAQLGVVETLLPLFRLAYRNMGTYETLVLNHDVDAGTNHAGIRWYEVRDPGGSPSIYQQGTFAPDADHRWLGSIAMDRLGDIALGYSVASSTLYPSIRYAGRLFSDPPGTLPQGEGSLIAGTGSQTGAAGRWGDYSRMAVDPSDDCTFWYTNEYYPTTSNSDWHTRIGAFRFPNCGPASPTPTVTGTPPTASPTRTAAPTATATVCAGSVYQVITGTATLVPATNDSGNHCDDCTTALSLPFPVTVYDIPYTTAYASANGNLQFASADGGTQGVSPACLPVVNSPPYRSTVFAFYDDLRTDITGTAPSGIFTATVGAPPNRQFVVKWHATYFAHNGETEFEIILNESAPTISVIYGASADHGANASTGMQRDLLAYTGYSCGTPGLVPGLRLDFVPVPCGATTPTATPTQTGTPPTATRTPTSPPASPTATPAACGLWTDAAPINATPGLARADAAYIPATGRVYVLGGRTSDVAGSFNDTIYTYDPAANTWSTAGTTLTDTNTSNLAVALLNGPGGAHIYAVGGNPAGGGSPPSDIVRVYDPVGATLGNADPWPQNPHLIPGGWAVFNNKLYMFGGYDYVGNTMSSNIWQFDPLAAPGSQWTQKAAHLWRARGYIAIAGIGSFIYIAGGSVIPGTEDTITERYDPTTDSITTVAPMLVASSNFKGYTDGSLFYAPGGFSTPNMLQVYNPATNTWSMGLPLNHAQHNYARATVGNSFYAIGGYTDGTTISNFNQRYVPQVCATPSATPAPPSATRTSTAVPTSTHTATPTACPIQFTDVPNPSTFYAYIRCLACRGIVNGYTDGTFRPNNNVTRGQLSKIVSNSAGFNEAETTQMFQDQPVGSTFYTYTTRLASRGYISGYPCGGPGEPCVPPGNLPYFRTNNNATRGQIAKIDANAAGFIEPPVGQTFEDVPPGSTFYTYTQRLTSRSIMQGYPCNSVPSEPCIPPDNLPYFRPNNNATRGQTSKIVANTFFPNCQTPQR